MKSDLNRLKFSEDELAVLTGISAESLRGSLCQNSGVRNAVLGKVWRDRHKFWSLISTEVILFGLSLILSLPLALFTTDKTLFSPTDSQLLVPIFLKAIGVSFALTIGVNFWVWLNVKSLITLIRLWDEVEKYHDVILAVDILDQLSAVGNLSEKFINRDEVIQALEVTRESLVNALKTERVLRENQNFIARRYALLADLEQNLATLMTFEVTNQANEYGQLLNETLQIGMSIHQEVRKFKQN